MWVLTRVETVERRFEWKSDEGQIEREREREGEREREREGYNKKKRSKLRWTSTNRCLICTQRTQGRTAEGREERHKHVFFVQRTHKALNGIYNDFLFPLLVTGAHAHPSIHPVHKTGWIGGVCVCVCEREREREREGGLANIHDKFPSRKTPMRFILCAKHPVMTF